jgi:hypothetical protein
LVAAEAAASKTAPATPLQRQTLFGWKIYNLKSADKESNRSKQSSMVDRMADELKQVGNECGTVYQCAIKADIRLPSVIPPNEPAKSN